MKVLVTGGLGFIGSHVALALHNEGHDVVIVDDLSNSELSTLHALSELGVTPTFSQLSVGELRDCTSPLPDGIDAVIHLAGYKSVPESVADPVSYYQNNVAQSIALVEVMERCGIDNILFSSSASVYAPTYKSNLTESSALGPISPYGRTKLMVEQFLNDCPGLNSLSLRYFNPIGCHRSGLLSDQGLGAPGNLFPRIINATLSGEPLKVFGDRYDTFDGTCVRDYIHVMDLAEAHVCALEHLMRNKGPQGAINVGTNQGTSVLGLIRAFEEVNKVSVPRTIAGAREGDPSYVVADASRALATWDWTPARTIQDACRDGWRAAQRSST